MCINTAEKFPSPPKRNQRSKKPKLQVLALLTRSRRRHDEKGREMELRNIKLYLENQTIFEENQKLRNKAYLLHQENLALISQFHQKFPHFTDLTELTASM